MHWNCIELNSADSNLTQYNSSVLTYSSLPWPILY